MTFELGIRAEEHTFRRLVPDNSTTGVIALIGKNEGCNRVVKASVSLLIDFMTE
jgi:hypothetical protein